MQWDASQRAGFTTGTPWPPLADDAARVNVEVEQHDPRSTLSLYRALIELRRSTPALAVGRYQLLLVDDHVLVYARLDDDGRRSVVALNFSPTPRELLVRDLGPSSQLRLSTHLDRSETILDGLLRLRANEGVVLLDVAAA